MHSLPPETLSDRPERLSPDDYLIKTKVAEAIDDALANPDKSVSLQPDRVMAKGVGERWSGQVAWTEQQRETVRGMIWVKLGISRDRIEDAERTVVDLPGEDKRVEIPLAGYPFSFYVDYQQSTPGDGSSFYYIAYSIERPGKPGLYAKPRS